MSYIINLFGERLEIKTKSLKPVTPTQRIGLFNEEQLSKWYRLLTRPRCMVIINEPYVRQKLIKKKWNRTRTKEGTLSANSRRKIRNVIRWLVAQAEAKQTYEKKKKKMVTWYVNMVTLTFHENMKDDSLARKVLSMWLETAKYRWDMRHYIWLAEPQQRGAIHFHLTTDVYIPHAELRYTWNKLLRKHGLNNIEDNSTDVHAVENISNHEAYLSDYFLKETKHEGRRAIKGKLWGCSHLLSQAGKKYISMREEDVKAFQYDNRAISLWNKLASENKQPPDWLKYADMYLTNETFYSNLDECELAKLYDSEIKKLREGKKQKTFWDTTAPLARP